jgi:hepatocyte growth factor-regulated tyrosine kinase substrate
MYDKLSQTVKLYDQLLSAQVAHPSRRNTATAGSTYPSALRQAAPDTSMLPALVASPNWAPPQTQLAVHAQIQPPSPRVSHPPPSIASVSHPIGYHLASLPAQPIQVVDSSVLQTVPNQGFAQIPTLLHSSQSPLQVDPSANLRTFSPPRQSVSNTGQSPLPNFPTAPTLAPQSSYMPSVPQSVIQQPDRQEALLIDL